MPSSTTLGSDGRTPTGLPDIGKGVCFATAVRKASRRLTQLYDEALAPCGLRSTQFSILAELAARASPPTLGDLADAMVSDRSAVGHALRPLIRDGLLVLHRGTADRRVQHAELTARGRDRFQEALVHWRSAQDRVVSLYGESRSSAFRAAVLEVAYDGRLGALTDEVAL